MPPSGVDRGPCQCIALSHSTENTHVAVDDLPQADTPLALLSRLEIALEVIEKRSVCAQHLANIAKQPLCFVERDDGCIPVPR